MDVIVEALKQQKNYSELKILWDDWESDLKSYLFLDLAIVHRCKDGVKLMGDLMGPEIYLTHYDEECKVTPLYIAQLLSRSHKDYEDLAYYMLNRIEASVPWNRKKSFIWLWKQGKAPKLPSCILKYLVQEFL